MDIYIRGIDTEILAVTVDVSDTVGDIYDKLPDKNIMLSYQDVPLVDRSMSIADSGITSESTLSCSLKCIYYGCFDLGIAKPVYCIVDTKRMYFILIYYCEYNCKLRVYDYMEDIKRVGDNKFQWISAGFGKFVFENNELMLYEERGSDYDSLEEDIIEVIDLLVYYKNGLVIPTTTEGLVIHGEVEDRNKDEFQKICDTYKLLHKK